MHQIHFLLCLIRAPRDCRSVVNAVVFLSMWIAGCGGSASPPTEPAPGRGVPETWSMPTAKVLPNRELPGSAPPVQSSLPTTSTPSQQSPPLNPALPATETTPPAATATALPPAGEPSSSSKPDSASAAPPSTLEKQVTNSIGMQLVLIPAGRFRMGSPLTEANRELNEKQVDVTLRRDFYIGMTEVTQRQWQDVMGTTPWKGRDKVREGDKYPATYVSWDEAWEYCTTLSKKEAGTEYRLPTEAEWEYACRGGTSTRYSFGDDDARLGEYAWYGGLGSGSARDERYGHAVATLKPNPFGLYDMHGNVWEWCADNYLNELPGGSDPSVRSTAPRVNRGGGWPVGAPLCRSAQRSKDVPSHRGSGIGFRVVRTIKMSPKLPAEEDRPKDRLADRDSDAAPTFAEVLRSTAAVPELATAVGLPPVAPADVLKAPMIRESRKSVETDGPNHLVAVSPDGKLMITGTTERGKALNLWRGAGQRPLPIKIDERVAPLYVEFSPEGTYFAVRSHFSPRQDERQHQWSLITVWNTKDLKPRELFPAEKMLVTAMCWVRDERFIAFANRFRQNEIWEVATSRPVAGSQRVEPPPGLPVDCTCGCLAASPDGRTLAGGTMDGRIRLYRVPDADALATVTDVSYGLVPIGDFRQGETIVRELVFSSDGKRLLSGGRGPQSAYLWDLDSRRPLYRFEGQGGTFSADGKRIVTSGIQDLDKAAIVWDAATGKALFRLHEDEPDLLTFAQLTPNGDGVVGAGWKEQIRFWNIRK